VDEIKHCIPCQSQHLWTSGGSRQFFLSFCPHSCVFFQPSHFCISDRKQLTRNKPSSGIKASFIYAHITIDTFFCSLNQGAKRTYPAELDWSLFIFAEQVVNRILKIQTRKRGKDDNHTFFFENQITAQFSCGLAQFSLSLFMEAQLLLGSTSLNLRVTLGQAQWGLSADSTTAAS